MSRNRNRNKSARKLVDHIVDHVSWGNAYVGEVPKGAASVLYDRNLRAMDHDRKVVPFLQLAEGGEFIIVPIEHLSVNVMDRMRVGRHSRAMLPPNSEAWLRRNHLVAMADRATVARGGMFDLFYDCDAAVVNSGLSDGEPVDRHHRIARRLSRFLFDRHPVLVANTHSFHGITALLPPRLPSGVHIL